MKRDVRKKPKAGSPAKHALKPNSRYIETVSGGSFTRYQQAIDRDFERHEHKCAHQIEDFSKHAIIRYRRIAPINAKKAALVPAMMD